MKLTFKAVLARFNGDYRQAANYCADIAATYPNLREEYYLLADAFLVAMTERRLHGIQTNVGE